MTDSSIINQLYQRKMFRITMGYLAIAWLLWQVVDTTCPAFECSLESQRTIFWLLLGGLPVTEEYSSRDRFDAADRAYQDEQ